MFGKLKCSWDGHQKGSILQFEPSLYTRLLELKIIEPADEPVKKQVGRPPKDKMVKQSANKAQRSTRRTTAKKG